MTTFLAPRAGATFVTRGSTYTSDSNTGLIINVPTGGYDQADLQNEGCVMLPFVPHAMFRNLLDGGDMSTNPLQRNIAGIYSAANVLTTIAGSPTYFADRFFAMGGSSSSILVSINPGDTSVPGFNQSLRFGRVVATTNTAAITLAQTLDTVNSLRLQGQQTCFSLWGRTDSGFTGANFTAAIIGGTGTNQAGSAQVAGGWTNQVTIATATFVPTASMTRYSVAGSVGTSITQVGVQVQYTPVGSNSAGDGLFLNGFQLELGNSPSPFEHRDAVVEANRCYRYAWVIPEPTSTAIVGNGACPTVSTVVGIFPTPVPMRAAPTVTALKGSFFVGDITPTVITAIAAGAYGATVSCIAVSVQVGASVAPIGGAAPFFGTGGGGYILATADL